MNAQSTTAIDLTGDYQIAVEGDRYKSAKCRIVNKNSIDLPEKTHFFQGLFTVKCRQQLECSVTVAIPQNIEFVPIETITIEVSNRNLSQS